MRRQSLSLLGSLLCVGLAQAQATFYPFTLAQPPLPPSSPAVERAPATAGADGFSVDTPAEKLRKFDPERLQVQHQKDRWVLTAGNVVVKDFGRSEQDAQEAARLIHSLNLDQLGSVGYPTPVMEYWLSNGEAPHLPLGSQHVVPLDPANLRVEANPSIGRWMLRNNARVIFSSFGSEEDARQALDVIQRHHFTHVVMVGQGGPSMQVFVSGGNAGKFPRTASTHSDEHVILPVTHTETKKQEQAPTFQPKMPSPRMTPSASTPTQLPSDMSSQATDLPHARTQEVKTKSQKVPFDFRQAQVHQEKEQYVLSCGSHVLATFGSDHEDAKKALTTLNRYQLNEQHRIGGPQSQFTYFLTNGKPPLAGDILGIRSYPLDLPSLDVRQDNNGFVIANQQQALWRFSDRSDAQAALAEIQKYKFDKVYYLGNGEGTGFMFFARSK